jgi:hypothetical protein
VPANLTQIVDSLSASPTVLLDLNNESPFGVSLFSAPPPEVGHSDSLRMSWYSRSRVVELTLDQIDASQDALASNWQTLARLIDLERFYLKYQPTGATSPVFFKCYRSQVPSIFEEPGAVAYRTLTLQILADPFAVGLPEDISSFVITNDAASGTNKMMVGPSILGTVKGDVETPLLLACTATSDTQFGGGMYVNGYAVRGGFTHSLLARNLTQLTSGTDTGAPVTGAGTAYMDGDYKACTFATALAMVTRLSGTFSTALSPMPGEYRALLKVVISFGAAGNVSYSFQGGFGNTASVNWLTEATGGYTVSAGGAATNHTVVDLGLVQFPVGVDTAGTGLGPPASAVSVNTYTEVKASAQLNSGTMPSLRFDELILLPVDTVYGGASTAIMTTNAVVGSGIDLLLDGESDTMRVMQEVGGTGPFAATPYAMQPGSVNGWIGGLPVVRPGTNNYVTVVGGFADGPTWTSTWSGRYYPRYLYVRPATT